MPFHFTILGFSSGFFSFGLFWVRWFLILGEEHRRSKEGRRLRSWAPRHCRILRSSEGLRRWWPVFFQRRIRVAQRQVNFHYFAKSVHNVCSEDVADTVWLPSVGSLPICQGPPAFPGIRWSLNGAQAPQLLFSGCPFETTYRAIWDTICMYLNRAFQRFGVGTVILDV